MLNGMNNSIIFKLDPKIMILLNLILPRWYWIITKNWLESIFKILKL